MTLGSWAPLKVTLIHRVGWGSGVSISFNVLPRPLGLAVQEPQVWGRQSWTEVTSLMLFKPCEQNVELGSINQRCPSQTGAT